MTDEVGTTDHEWRGLESPYMLQYQHSKVSWWQWSPSPLLSTLQNLRLTGSLWDLKILYRVQPNKEILQQEMYILKVKHCRTCWWLSNTQKLFLFKKLSFRRGCLVCPCLVNSQHIKIFMLLGFCGFVYCFVKVRIYPHLVTWNWNTAWTHHLGHTTKK